MIPDELKRIGHRLHTQDNRITANPVFCVQVCERIGPIIMNCNEDGLMVHDHQESETYYDDGPDVKKFRRILALANDGRQTGRYTAAGYKNVWRTVQTCFSESGAERHLNLNGHNYRHYHGTRIYVESFNRNPEMLAIREFLLEHSK